MNTVLLVDDDPVIRQFLRDALISVRPEWQLLTAANACEALTTCAQAKIHAVISDIEMPGMCGDELLQHIARAFPLVARFVLSSRGQSARELKAMGICQRFFLKPVDVVELAESIEHSLALRKGFTLPRFQKLFSQLGDLPSPPEQYFALRGLLAKDDVHLGTLTEVIAKDPSVSTLALKLANSTFFQQRYPVTTIQHAANVVGLESLVSLVLAREVYGHLPVQLSRQLRLDEVWRHSLQVAELSALLAFRETRSRELKEECYTAGLVHDMGKAILARTAPDQYKQALRLAQTKHLSERQAEKEIIDACHDEIGGYVLALWGLPDTIVAAVAFHHDPARATAHGKEPAPDSPLVFVSLANELLHVTAEFRPGTLRDLETRKYIEQCGRGTLFASAEAQIRGEELRLSAW